MALLKFNKGLYKNLDKQPIIEGNVYITTDEQAMYVDVATDKRIRIGQIVDVASRDLKPPYAHGTFYYLNDINALVKWDATLNDNAGGWVQINGTGDLDRRVTTIETTLNGEQGLVATVSSINSKVNTLDETIKGLNLGEDNIIEEIQVNGEKVDPVNKVVKLGKLAGVDVKVSTTDLDETLTKEIGQVTTNKNDISTLNSQIGTLNGGVDDVGSVAHSVKGAIDAFRTNEFIAVKDQSTTNNTSILALQKIVGAGNGEDGKSLTVEIDDIAAIANQNKTDIGNLNSRVSSAEGSIATLVGDKTVNGSVAQAKAAADAAQAHSEGVAGNLAELSETVNTISETASTAKTTADKNKEDIASLNSTINTLNDTYATDEELTQTKNALDLRLKAVEESVGLGDVAGTGSTLAAQVATNTQDIKDIKDIIGTPGDGADTLISQTAALREDVGELQTKVANVTTVMDFVGVVAAVPSDGTSDYQKGDVIVVAQEDSTDNGKEFVYDGAKWHELGSTSATDTQLATLKDRVDTIDTDLNAAETGLKAQVSTNKAVFFVHYLLCFEG